MRAVVYDTYGKLPRVEEVSPPVCPPGGAVIGVRAAGVCRSDWHAWRGHDPVALPHTPGHEFAGVVTRIGEGVRDFAVGDRVTAPFACGCGTCEWCRAGDAQVCPSQYQPGFSGPGAFAESVAIPAADANLVRLPDGMDFSVAASLGCRFATAYRAVRQQGRLGQGQWLAVFGCGGLGLSAVMIGRALGARVVAVDVSADALARATALGAELAFDATELDETVESIVAATGGVHVGLDALGAPALADASIRSLRRRGRHVQGGLLLGESSRPALPMDRVIAWELEILGSHGMAAADYPEMLELIASGRVDPADLIGRRITLDEAGAALAAMDGPTPAGVTIVTIPGSISQGG